MESVHNLYVHFPWCESKCHYCDFFSLPEEKSTGAERTRMYSSIGSEFALFPQSSYRTVFLGGGTPSLVPVEDFAAFLARVKLEPGAEVTMEANPSSIDAEKIPHWLKAGVTRISMGVQALEDERLKWLGRVHSVAGIHRALDALFSGGVKSVSTDYIVGVPGQSERMIRDELSTLLSRYPGIRHISAYLLTLKTSNVKFKELPSEDTQLSHLRTVRDVLAEHGFEQYEISNFAKPDARARHNENYWLGGGYLGVGPSAHSHFPKSSRRTKNWASLGKYVELVEGGAPGVEWDETLDDEQKRIEYLMLRLRRKEGFLLDEYANHFAGRRIERERSQVVDDLVSRGLCRISGGVISLTSDGFFLSDQVLSRLV